MKNKILRIGVYIVGGVVAAAGVGFVGASIATGNKLSAHFESHHIDIAVPTPLSEAELAALRAERADLPLPEGPEPQAPADPLAGVDLAALAQERAAARGKHLVEARYGCNACHGENFAGGEMLDDPAIGSIRGPNITRGKGGLPADFQVGDWDRIVRHGIKRDGTPAVMPSEDFFAMTDQELSDIIAYIRSRPPVDAEVPAPTFGPIGKILVAVGKFPLSAEKLPDHQKAHVQAAPEVADTIAFGNHLAGTCRGCHRENLAGGPMPFGPPDWPAAGNLTQHASGLAGMSFAEFEKSLLEGTSKNGSKLCPLMTHLLPGLRGMLPIERKALWTFLTSLPSQPTNP